METILETSEGHVSICRNWLTEEETSNLQEHCNTLPMVQIHNNVFGKTIAVKRLNYACGDSDVGTHKYSNTHSEVKVWSDPILDVRNAILRQCGYYLDSCLLNYYKDGNDYIFPHSDKEVHGPGKMVVTVSLGASRRFIFRSKKLKEFNVELRKNTENANWNEVDATVKADIQDVKINKNKDIEMQLHSGDVVIMFGDIQDKFTHTIPQQKKIKEQRISLTFRLLAPNNLENKGIRIVDEAYSYSRNFPFELPNNVLRH